MMAIITMAFVTMAFFLNEVRKKKTFIFACSSFGREERRVFKRSLEIVVIAYCDLTSNVVDQVVLMPCIVFFLPVL